MKSTPVKLVNLLAYCLNPNHFHLLIEQLVPSGVSKFMRSVAGGYSKYFNERYQRKGTLFQGPFRAKWIDGTDYLKHVSVYVNLNNRAHRLGSELAHLVRSSWGEYSEQTPRNMLCNQDAVLRHFVSKAEYHAFADESLKEMLEAKNEQKELRVIMLDD
jgi:hypothetical protein